MGREIRPWESAGAGSGQQSQGGWRGLSSGLDTSFCLCSAPLSIPVTSSFSGTCGCPHQTRFILLFLPQLKPWSSRMARWTLRAFWQRHPDVLCDMLVLHPVQASQFSFVCLLLGSSAFPLTCSSVHPASYFLPIYPSSLYPSPFLSPTHPLPSTMHTHLVFPSESSSVVTSKHTILRQCAGRPGQALTWF